MRRHGKRGLKKQRNHGFSTDWQRRLNIVKAQFRSTTWPSTAEEGLHQVLALSDHGWVQLISGLKAENPGASARQLEDAAHRLLRRWDDARQTLILSRKNQKA
jgi:hypothetical protein